MFIFRPRFNWFDVIVITVWMGLHTQGIAKYSDWWYWLILIVCAVISAFSKEYNK